MKVLLLLLVITCLLVKGRGKIFSRCELVLMLQHSGLDGYQGYSLAEWVCLAYFASGFNTAKVTHNSDGTSEYGIFQINSRLWCSDHHSTTKDLCDISCRDDRCAQASFGTILEGAFLLSCENKEDWLTKQKMDYKDLLTDEIVDDVDCIKKAVVDSEGLNAWMGWRDHCRGRNLNYWINACNV